MRRRLIFLALLMSANASSLMIASSLNGKKTHIGLYKDLIESIYIFDPPAVSGELDALPHLNKEAQSRLLRVVDSLIVQEAYKKKRIRNSSLLHAVSGGTVVALCALYLYLA